MSINQQDDYEYEYKSLYRNAENLTYFDSFSVDDIPKESRKFIGNKNIMTNIYRI